MTFNLDYKTLTSFVVSILLVAIQAIQGVYAGGITGIEWLGIAAIILGPAGLVAAVNNTAWSPATKALAQHVSTVAIILIQGIAGVYSNGISQQEWLGLGLLLLSTLAVYVVPGYTPAALAGRHRNQVGAALGTLGYIILIITAALFILLLFKIVLVSWVLLLVGLIIGVVLVVLDGRRGGPVV